MAVSVHLPDDVFRLPWTVRYYEADQQAVVYHGWYLNYFDEAFMAFLDSREYGYGRMHGDNVDVMLVHTEVDWHGSLRWPDTADIAVSPVHVGTSSLTMDYAAIRDGSPVCSARTVYVTVEATTFSRIDVPQVMREALGPPVALRRPRAGR